MTPEKQLKAKKSKMILNVSLWETTWNGNLGRLVQADRVGGQQTWIELKRRRMKVKRKIKRGIEFSIAKNLITFRVMTFPCLEGRTMTRCQKLEMVV